MSRTAAWSRPLRTEKPQHAYRATKIGSSVDFRGDLPPGAVNGDQPQAYKVRLLDVDLAQLAPRERYASGAWVLILSSEVIEHNINNGIEVVPIIATIHLGAGGAAHDVEVNAFPGATLQLPVPVTNVSLRWDTIPPQNTIVTQRYKVPIVTRVRATLQRGFSSVPAHRSYLGEVDTTGVPLTFTGPVPPFARTLGTYATRAANLWLVGSEFTFFEAGGQQLLELNGTELATIMRDGRRVAVPSTASTWRLRNLATGFEGTRIDFEVSL